MFILLVSLTRGCRRDEQFNQTVKIRSISIQSKNVEQAPKTIRLYINRPSLTFSDVEDGSGSLQEIELTEEDVTQGKKIPLRFVRFQSVTSLHVSGLHCGELAC